MPTWMLVEDEADLYDMILAMYGMLGIGGIAFSTGEETFAWIESVEEANYSEEIPELALIDIRLPDSIDGPTVAARMKESTRLKDTVIVLMTAYRLTPGEEREVMQKAGAALILYKPLPPFRDLEQLLRDVADTR